MRELKIKEIYPVDFLKKASEIGIHPGLKLREVLDLTYFGVTKDDKVYTFSHNSIKVKDKGRGEVSEFKLPFRIDKIYEPVNENEPNFLILLIMDKLFMVDSIFDIKEGTLYVPIVDLNSLSLKVTPHSYLFTRLLRVVDSVSMTFLKKVTHEHVEEFKLLNSFLISFTRYGGFNISVKVRLDNLELTEFSVYLDVGYEEWPKIFFMDSDFVLQTNKFIVLINNLIGVGKEHTGSRTLTLKKNEQTHLELSKSVLFYI